VCHLVTAGGLARGPVVASSRLVAGAAGHGARARKACSAGGGERNHSGSGQPLTKLGQQDVAEVQRPATALEAANNLWRVTSRRVLVFSIALVLLAGLAAVTSPEVV
jgi:hypothetical protein